MVPLMGFLMDEVPEEEEGRTASTGVVISEAAILGVVISLLQEGVVIEVSRLGRLVVEVDLFGRAGDRDRCGLVAM